MLKFENIAKVGDVIRAYDFKPMLKVKFQLSLTNKVTRHLKFQ